MKKESNFGNKIQNCKQKNHWVEKICRSGKKALEMEKMKRKQKEDLKTDQSNVASEQWLRDARVKSNKI